MTQTRPELPEDLLERSSTKLRNARQEIGKVVFGQQKIIDQTLISLICGGHVLLVGVPGLAKTLLVQTVAKVMGLSNARIQCTPDLMPSDILGSEILETDEDGKRHFRFIEGPVFTQFLMVDEINRASPRTQSALLEAMQEKQVTVNGQHKCLPHPFHVLATQNPLEQEGTYPLPEAQLDRFLMQINVDYPDRDTEKNVLLVTTSNDVPEAKEVLNGDAIMDIQKLVRDMPIGDQVVDTILDIVRGARPDEHSTDLVRQYVQWAPGPRAAQALMLAVRAAALLDGRHTPSLDDVKDYAEPVLQHRMALSYQAQADSISLSDILNSLFQQAGH